MDSNDCKKEIDNNPFSPSTIETIDEAMFEWIRSRNLFVRTKEGFKTVPILWASAERSFQVKGRDDIRDETGAMIYPVISVQRVSIEKSLTRRVGLPNTFGDVDQQDHRRGAIQIAKKINQTKSKNYANQRALRDDAFRPIGCENQRVVFDVFSIPQPVFINVNYKLTFRAEYQQQMNTMTTPFIIYPGGINEFIVSSSGHSFPAFVQESFASADNVTSYTEEERKFESTIDIKVLGYLIGAEDNQAGAIPARRETVAELHLPRERLMYGALGDYEEIYGQQAMDAFSEKCCPSQVPAMPQRFGRIGSQAELQGGGAAQQVVSINIVQVENVVDERVGEILIFREFLNEVAGNQIGAGNLHFATTSKFKAGSESLYLNGMLLYPGTDYVVWDGNVQGRPAYQGVSFIDNRPPPDGVGNDPHWVPPRTAVENGHQPGENDGLRDDIILISYIKA